MITRGSLHLKDLSFISSGINTSSRVVFRRTWYEMLDLSGDAATTTGLSRLKMVAISFLVAVVAVAVIAMMLT